MATSTVGVELKTFKELVLPGLSEAEEKSPEENPPTLKKIEALADFNEKLIAYEVFFKDQEPTPEEKIRALMGRGRTFFFLGRFDEAQEDFEQVLQCLNQDKNVFASSKKAEAFRELALVCCKRGDIEQAIKNFEKGCDICPTYSKVRWSYVEFLQNKEKLEEAIEVCNRGLSADFIYLRAKIYSARPEWHEKALKDCQKFLEMPHIQKEERIEILELEVKLYEKQGNLVKAADYLRKANCQKFSLLRSKEILELRVKENACKEMSDSRKIQAAEALMQEDLKKAFELVDEVLKKGSLDEKALLVKAKLYFSEGKLTEARTALNAIKNHSLDSSLLYSEICQKENNVEEAIHHLKSAFTLARDFPAWSKYFHFLLEQKRFEQAKEALSHLRQPEECNFYEAKIYYAREDWEKLKELDNKTHSSRRIEMYDMLAVAYEKTKDFVRSYLYLKTAYENDRSPACIKRGEKLKQLHPFQESYTTSSQPFYPKNPLSLLQIAREYAEKDPEGALAVFSKVERPFYRLEDKIALAKAHLALGNLDAARAFLEQALQNSKPPSWKEKLGFSSPLSIREKELQAHFLFARLSIQKKDLNEAHVHFDKGWEIAKLFLEEGEYAILPLERKDFVLSYVCKYIEFLQSGEKYSKALDICEEVEKRNFDCSYHRAISYFHQQKWELAFSTCKIFLSLSRSLKRNQTIREFAIEICVLLGEYDEAKNYAVDAYEEETNPLLFFSRFEKMKEISEMHLISLHLKEVSESLKKGREKDITACLAIYKKELATQPLQHAVLLHQRAHLSKSEGQRKSALQDLNAALQVLQATPNRFRREIESIEHQIEAAKIEQITL